MLGLAVLARNVYSLSDNAIQVCNLGHRILLGWLSTRSSGCTRVEVGRTLMGDNQKHAAFQMTKSLWTTRTLALRAHAHFLARVSLPRAAKGQIAKFNHIPGLSP